MIDGVTTKQQPTCQLAKLIGTNKVWFRFISDCYGWRHASCRILPEMGALKALIWRVIPNIHGAYARHLSESAWVEVCDKVLLERARAQ